MVVNMKTLISANLAHSIMAKEAFVKESLEDILRLTEWIREVFENGGKWAARCAGTRRRSADKAVWAGGAG